MKRLVLIFFFIFNFSCSQLEFVYSDKNEGLNPLYNKTNVTTSGLDLIKMKSYTKMMFGDDKEQEFNLYISVFEKKTKRSIETNQATSTLRYELRFDYKLVLNKDGCVVFNQELLSYFSIIPKSSGYNYGTDISLEKKYELAMSENLNRFVSLISDINLYNCR